MTAPSRVVLTDPQSWTAAPMPGSSHPLDLVRLAAAPGRFTIHARFPAGFARLEPGGYRATEEFLVLDGALEIDDTVYRRGDLTVVPSDYRRGSMRSPGGCRVLAWFDGRADFLPGDQLGQCREPLVSTSIDSAGAVGHLLTSSVATWGRGASGAGATVEVVSANLDCWERGGALTPGSRDLVRREL